LRKGSSPGKKCEIVNYTGKGAFSKDLLNGEGNVEITSHEFKNSDLFYSDELFIKVNSSGSSSEDSDVVSLMQTFSHKVSDFFSVNQGIVTGVNRIGKKHVENYPNLNIEKNEGVFILEGDEAKKLLADPASRKILKPLFKNTDIERFSTSKKTDKYLIYTAPDLCIHEKLPSKIKKHLSKFMPIIENTVDNPPYLHRSREESIFLSEKIVVPYRSKENVFGYSKGEWFAAQDVYFITSNSKDFPLKALLALANSSPYMTWLWNMGKRKGNMLEMMNTPLMNLPLPSLSKKQINSLTEVSEVLIKSKGKVEEKELEKLDKVVLKIFSELEEGNYEL
jgi:adenine-specific DNA-methyltransferase